MGSAMTAMSFSAFDLGLGVHPHLSLGCLWLEGLRYFVAALLPSLSSL